MPECLSERSHGGGFLLWTKFRLIGVDTNLCRDDDGVAFVSVMGGESIPASL